MTTATDPQLYKTAAKPTERRETPAVVLAGGTAKPELEAVIGVKIRALAEVNGKTLLGHVVDSLDGVLGIGEITVVGDVPESSLYKQVPDGGDIVTNIYAGLERYRNATYVLVSTSDLPYITAPPVASFLEEAIRLAEESRANIIYPIVEVAACYAKFPGIKRTARKFKEGAFTGGNMVLLRPEFMERQHQVIATAYAARKSTAKLAAMFGLGTLIRLVLSQTISPALLSVALLEERASSMLGGKVKALVCPHPEIATDFDKPSNFLNQIAPTRAEETERNRKEQQ
jgi:molybdopterin-guanine dinucleotide biosynthesis protein A